MQTTDTCSEVVRDIVDNHIVAPPAVTVTKGITHGKSEEVGNKTYNDITSDLVPTAVTAAMVITNATTPVAHNVIYDNSDSEFVTPPPFDYHNYPGTSEPAPMKPILLSKLIPIEIRDEAYEIYKASHHKSQQDDSGVNGEIFRAVEGLANEDKKSVDRYGNGFGSGSASPSRSVNQGHALGSSTRKRACHQSESEYEEESVSDHASVLESEDEFTPTTKRAKVAKEAAKRGSAKKGSAKKKSRYAY